MGRMFDSVPDDLKFMSQAKVDLQQLDNLMKYIDGQIMTIRENHESFTFTDRALCMTVFDGLK